MEENIFFNDCFLGPVSGVLIGKVGRKPTMLLTAFLFAMSFLLLTCAQNVTMILIGTYVIRLECYLQTR